ncbi:PREDICTED: galectin-4-like isoform X2 [Poecilia mexicana]|uniref:galectin-4-like isoform X2 n=1 Tax=Poecilia mexicana TaxID=48701 RepID=UPI00072DDF10|nr:PREDICTED: galectin-4-like isoform X2 [Poecilia mexicana]XP_016527153.1 PREDICTED: galectin-4 isoform X2 [Poecilia formosa]
MLVFFVFLNNRLSALKVADYSNLNYFGPLQSIPYLGPIYGGVRVGASVYIQGSVPENITRFRINLLCGESDSSDVALHFNPRFDGWDKVVFNSRKDGSWMSEEKIRRMPFSKGEAFELVIMITSKGFQTKVNGKDFFLFPHRLPVEQIRAIQVSGDVSIQTINIIGAAGGGGALPGGTGGGYPGGNMGQGGYPGGSMGGGYPDGMGGGMGQGGYPGGHMGAGCPDGMGGRYPGSDMGGGFPGSHLPVREKLSNIGIIIVSYSCFLMFFSNFYKPVQGMAGQPVYNPPVPFSTWIPGGMLPKRTIIIRGSVPHGAQRMGFNLVVSRTRDVAFHMNPRVQEGVVVRNAQTGGQWGSEERQLSGSPFAEGQYFDMSIRCGNQRFKVFVNGQHLFDFFHRTNFSEIDKLEIDGDVQISYVHF